VDAICIQRKTGIREGRNDEKRQKERLKLEGGSDELTELAYSEDCEADANGISFKKVGIKKVKKKEIQ